VSGRGGFCKQFGESLKRVGMQQRQIWIHVIIFFKDVFYVTESGEQWKRLAFTCKWMKV
jgi:CRISPR/Cas system CSM-associated protein Csm3 (group 7 of RAMP superfamily)